MIHPLGRILLDKKQISETVLQSALAAQHDIDASEDEQVRLGELLCSRYGIAEETVYTALAEQFNMTFVATVNEKINQELLQEFPSALIQEACFLPVDRTDTTVLAIIADPLDLDSILTLQAITGLTPDTRLTTPTELRRAVDAIYKGDSMLRHSMGKISREYELALETDESGLSIDEMKKRTEAEPVVRMASLIFDEAIKLKASDIHIEPAEHIANIRYRIDGLLTQHMEVAKGMYVPITSRIKIMAGLDIAEKRVPQDGRIRYEYMNEQFDFRVSTLPTHWGEKTVIRILKHDTKLLALDKVGFGAAELQSITELIEKPQGMIFVTGPTGSGKSSTLFACLNAIRQKEINITTIEDPIEYKIEGVNQVQINEKAGVTFAATLRSILRQDPDVILVGEIRDRETAEIAIQASQTGHLVFSTLHTNDAISAITRLKDLGIPGFLISSSLLGILAQRLVRLLCPHCKAKGMASQDVLDRWKFVFPSMPMPNSYQPVGCDSCHNLGYKGRIGIFELAQIGDATRNLIADNASESKVRQYFRTAGMKTLIQNGFDKIEQGLTTPEELLRVVMVEDVISMKEAAKG